MLDFLALITKKRFWGLHSIIVKFILTKLYHFQIGSNFYIECVPYLKINGKGENIIIGDNVSILGGIDLRNRENGKIILKNNSTIDGPVRIVSAREGTVELGEGSIITPYALINRGSDIIIGDKTIIGPRTSINANDHVFRRNTPVREAGFIHEPVTIGHDCWLAANVIVMKGVAIADGSVVGAGAIVTKDTDPYSINVGTPSKKINERS